MHLSDSESSQTNPTSHKAGLILLLEVCAFRYRLFRNEPCSSSWSSLILPSNANAKWILVRQYVVCKGCPSKSVTQENWWNSRKKDPCITTSFELRFVQSKLSVHKLYRFNQYNQDSLHSPLCDSYPMTFISGKRLVVSWCCSSLFMEEGNPHSAEQKHQSLSLVILRVRMYVKL